MLRYEIIGNIMLDVNLHNGYSVMAIAKWNREIEKYTVTLFIKNNKYNINHFDLIEEYEDVVFESDIKTIKTDITGTITSLLNDGYFNKYIERYGYERKCFEKGNELFEKERLGEK